MSEALAGWSLDLATCFIVIGFVFSLKIFLLMTKNANYTWKDLGKEAAVLFSGGQASLLVVTYNITCIRTIFQLNYIKYFRSFLITVWVIIIIYNILMYVLVKEIGYIEDGKRTMGISFIFFIISVLGSLVYTIAQVYI